MARKALLVCISIFLVTACIPLTPPADGTATQNAPDQSATQTAATSITLPVPSETSALTGTPEPLPGPAETASPTLPGPAQGQTQFLAYVSDGQLLVTDVTNGVKGGTTQYTMTGESDQIIDVAWSPSGELVAFVSTAKGDPQIFYIFALGQSSPTPLGPGSAIAWSPDSQSIAYIGGTFPNENIFITSLDNPLSRQVTFETNYAWGRPAFTPDGQSLVVACTSRDNLGASGNTVFTLETLALDGSGTRTPLPYTSPFEGVRLPYDLHFSPDGKALAFSTSSHLSACAAPGAYYVSNADGSGLQTYLSPSLQPLIDPSQDRYQTGLSYAWAPSGEAIVALGNVMDCNLDSPTTGQVIGGPQISILGMDGSERTIIPGFFYELSMDRSGSLIAGAHYEDGFQDMDPEVEIYSAETGQLVLPLGPGILPRFQP